MRDPYELMAVPRSATTDDIKKSFRQLAKKLHPDANQNNPKAAALFAELNAAHAILVDKDKRKAFDRGDIDAEGKPTSRETTPPKPSTANVVSSLIMVMSMLATTAMLILRGLETQANDDARGNVWQRWEVGKEDVDDDFKALSGPHLILQPNDFYAVDGTVPLGIQVSGKAADLTVQISGLPPGMRISSGRVSGGRWRVPATDLDNAMIHPPPGFNGTIDLAVELQLADDTVVDHALFRLEWQQTPTVGPIMVEPADVMVSSGITSSKMTVALAPTDRNVIDNTAHSQLDHQPIKLFSGGSQHDIGESDFATARTLLRPPVGARDELVVRVPGATRNPIMLAILQTRGVAVDDFLAPDWYQKVGKVGSREEQQRLNFVTAKLIPLESGRAVTSSDDAARKLMPVPAEKSKKHVLRVATHIAPTHVLGRPHDLAVARPRIGAGPDLLTLAPAFLQ
jgi:DnaJ domain